MAHTRSNLGLGLQMAIGPMFLLGIMIFTGMPPILTGVVTLAMAFYAWSEFRKRSTLRRRDDGVYVWIEWYGFERTSVTDPSKPGGAWDCDGDGGGDGGD